MNSVFGAWQRFWAAPVEQTRSYVLIRLLLPLLAFDCWVDLLPHGGRYGVGGFNVAHFGILDVLPVPSPATYVGTMILVGWLAMAIAVAGPTVYSMACLTILYTYGWAMSMLDSYQHHYLVSLVLVSATFLPAMSGTKLFPKPVGRSELHGLGISAFVMSTVYLVFVYLDVIVPETQTGSKLAAGLFVVSLLVVVFFSQEKQSDVAKIPLIRKHLVYFLLGVLVLVIYCAYLISWGSRPGILIRVGLFTIFIAIQFRKTFDPTVAPRGRENIAYVSIGFTCAVVYFYTAITKTEPDWLSGAALQRLVGSKLDGVVQTLAAGSEMSVGWERMAWGAIAVQLVSCFAYLVAPWQDSAKRLAPAVWLLSLGPLSFHIGVERIGLSIGWFSAYMFAIGFVFFSPSFVIDGVARVLSVPHRVLGDRVESIAPKILVASILVFCALSYWVAKTIDLPGAIEGCAVALVLTTILGVRSFTDTKSWKRSNQLILGAVAATCLMFAATTFTEVRFDYYRFVGGDLRRRQDFEGALEAYVKANAYAPEGKDRKAKEAQVREILKSKNGRTDG